MSNRYYLLNRPPSLGTHPPGETGRETWLPKRAIPTDLPGYERQACGYVEYAAPLPLAQVWNYELEPDPAHRPLWLIYRYWLDAGRDPQEAEWMLRDAWESELAAGQDWVDRVLVEYKMEGGQLQQLVELLSTLAGEG
jgi:hypothetical protein